MHNFSNEANLSIDVIAVKVVSL